MIHIFMICKYGYVKVPKTKKTEKGRNVKSKYIKYVSGFQICMRNSFIDFNVLFVYFFVCLFLVFFLENLRCGI